MKKKILFGIAFVLLFIGSILAQPLIDIPENQNFLSTEHLIIKGNIDEDLPIKLTLIDPKKGNEPIVYTNSSDSEFQADFGLASQYSSDCTVKIEIQNVSKTYFINVHVIDAKENIINKSLSFTPILLAGIVLIFVFFRKR